MGDFYDHRLRHGEFCSGPHVEDLGGLDEMHSLILIRCPSFLRLDFDHLAFFSSFAGGQKNKEKNAATRNPVASRKMSTVMGLEVVPVLGGLEATAALFAGHIPGVVVGVATVLWTTVLKVPVAEAPILKGAIGGSIGSFLTFLTVAMLGVRAYTVGPDTRYIDAFPTDVAHPLGCTRVAPEGGNQGIDVPTFKSSVEDVQAATKDWFDAQPRTRLVTDTPGYIHAKCLSLLFGFPDSVGVKMFANKAGKTEVWVQSELRVGQGDLGVNLNRTKALLEYLEKKLS
eukprot:jgi/Undpi1/4039/HiC_scaffold_16.g07406.m1